MTFDLEKQLAWDRLAHAKDTMRAPLRDALVPRNFDELVALLARENAELRRQLSARGSPSPAQASLGPLNAGGVPGKPSLLALSVSGTQRTELTVGVVAWSAILLGTGYLLGRLTGRM